MANIPYHPKYGYFDCDSLTGFDSCMLIMQNFCFHGFFLQSPLDAYMHERYNVVPTSDPLKKPFKARWIISDKTLELGAVNAILNGRTLYTNEIYPEYPEEEILHPVKFDGVLDFIALSMSSNKYEVEHQFNFDNDHYKLTFSGGIQIKAELVIAN